MKEKECKTIAAFLQHIFGSSEVTYTSDDNKSTKSYKMLDLGFDYLQLLYQQPQQKLPILCLVGPQNSGKSLFARLLSIMLGGSNVAIVGKSDLVSEFNSHWATKNVVVLDEFKIDNKTKLKITYLNTARKIWVNERCKEPIEHHCSIKFVVLSNDDFIFDDVKTWVIQIAQSQSFNSDILNQFTEEMPAFLSFLSSRKLCTEDKSRMWFHPSLLEKNLSIVDK